VRDASRLGNTRIALAPLIRAQGNARFSPGEMASAAVRSMRLAYDAEKRLQQAGLAPAFNGDERVQQAGPTEFADTVAGVQKSIRQTTTAIERAGDR
jgi:hypothetical protein